MGKIGKNEGNRVTIGAGGGGGGGGGWGGGVVAVKRGVDLDRPNFYTRYDSGCG